MSEEIKIISISVLVIVMFIFFIMFFVYAYTVNIGEANIVQVYVKGQCVFEGKKAFVDIDSGGMTTTVTLYKQLFPFYVIARVYSDKDVSIINGEEGEERRK